MSIMSSALGYLHSQRILHRDLKPENVLLKSAPGGSLDVKIADFGIAKLLNQKSKNDYYGRNCSVGTACYMAPEALAVSLLSIYNNVIFYLTRGSRNSFVIVVLSSCHQQLCPFFNQFFSVHILRCFSTYF